MEKLANLINSAFSLANINARAEYNISSITINNLFFIHEYATDEFDIYSVHSDGTLVEEVLALTDYKSIISHLLQLYCNYIISFTLTNLSFDS